MYVLLDGRLDMSKSPLARRTRPSSVPLTGSTIASTPVTSLLIMSATAIEMYLEVPPAAAMYSLSGHCDVGVDVGEGVGDGEGAGAGAHWHPALAGCRGLAHVIEHRDRGDQCPIAARAPIGCLISRRDCQNFYDLCQAAHLPPGTKRIYATA